VTAEVTWLRWLLTDFGVALSSTPVHCDRTSAINIAQDPVKHELTKYVGVDCFYVWSADLLTKAHTRAQHCFLLSKMWLIHLEFEGGVLQIHICIVSLCCFPFVVGLICKVTLMCI
jgi:hypothetical protein